MSKISSVFFLALFLLSCLFIFPIKVSAEEEGLELLYSEDIFLNDVAVGDGIAYAAGGDSVRIYDISDPENIHQIGSYGVDGCNFQAVEVKGDVVYTSQAYYSCGNNLHILDVSDPTNPYLITEDPIGFANYPSEIQVVGNIVYMIGGSRGLSVIDISDPSDPIVHPDYNPRYGIYYADLGVIDDIVFIANRTGGFYAVDISDPSDPSVTAEYGFPTGPFAECHYNGITVRDNLMYIAAGECGLLIVDISDLSNIYEVGSLDITGYPFDIEVSGDYAFIVSSTTVNNPIVVDISDVENPALVEEFSSTDREYSVAIWGNLVLTGGQDFNVFRFSALPPAPPVPFLDLPWDYEANGMDFSTAALAINSFFDHEYPLLSVGLGEPYGVMSFNPDFIPLDSSYSSHDGYDWGSRAKTKYGVPQLAAADGVATYIGTCGGCGNAILIDHGNGFQTRHYHLQKEGLIVDTAGVPIQVSQGQQIGLTGFSGNVRPPNENGSHIHFVVVHDKNGDGNFSDNIPDGLMDPFGWQSNDPDPWENYSFTYGGVERTGSKSYYLWKKPIDSLSESFDSNGKFFEMGDYAIDIPENATQEELSVSMKTAPFTEISGDKQSVGPTLVVTVRNAAGEIVNFLGESYNLYVDFAFVDLSGFDPDTLSIYSSEDGENWVKEDTEIDWTEKAAAASLIHFSYFALMADRIDTSPPSTSVSLLGDEGEDDWFRSDVAVELFAEDNENGLGVAYTAIRIDDDEWEEYLEPIQLTEEGTHKVYYYSEDTEGNVEETKEIELHIDKTLPEARVQFNPGSFGLEVIPVYSEDFVVEEQGARNRVVFEVYDKSGNTLKISGIGRNAGRAQNLILSSLRYNENNVIELNPNNFHTSYRTSDGSIYDLNQMWVEKSRQFLVYYNGNKNISKIFIREEGEKTWKEEEGMKILYLTTNNGNLELNYK